MGTARFAVLTLLLAIGGCGVFDRPATSSSFDELTGESLSHPVAPTTFVAERPGLSAIGRDYLSLSPVTVSGRGAPVTWLWCAMNSSIDRDLKGARPPRAESLVLVVDDVPMSLKLEAWSTAASRSPFASDHTAQQSYAARITRSQLDRITSSARIEAWIVEADLPSSRYTLSADSRDAWQSY